MVRKLFLIGLICAFLAPTNVFAEKGKWSFTPYLGAIAATSRGIADLQSQTFTTIAASTADGRASVTAGGVITTSGDIDLNDSHGTPILTGFDVGYSLSDTLEVFGGFEYVTAGSDTVTLASVTTGFTVTVDGVATVIVAGDAVNAEAENYNSWAIKLGATKYFPRGDYTPYVGGYGGFKHIDAMDVTIKIRAAAGNADFDIKYLDSTNTGFFGIHTGVNRAFTMGGTPLVLGVRARLDYTPDFNDDDEDLDLVGGESINDTGSGVDFGLTAHVSIPF